MGKKAVIRAGVAVFYRNRFVPLAEKREERGCPSPPLKDGMMMVDFIGGGVIIEPPGRAGPT